MTERYDWETSCHMAVVSWSNAAQIGGGRTGGASGRAGRGKATSWCADIPVSAEINYSV
jgi:hypothetical protein